MCPKVQLKAERWDVSSGGLVSASLPLTFMLGARA